MKKLLLLLLSIVLVSFNLFSQNETEKPSRNPNQFFEESVFTDGVNEIILYSKNSCSRCTSIEKMLINANIEFTKVEIDDKMGTDLDTRILQALPYPTLGYSTRYPVIEINENLYYSLNNHAEFTQKLIALYK